MKKGVTVNDVVVVVVACKCELIIESNKLTPVCFSIQNTMLTDSGRRSRETQVNDVRTVYFF